MSDALPDVTLVNPEHFALYTRGSELVALDITAAGMAILAKHGYTKTQRVELELVETPNPHGKGAFIYCVTVRAAREG